MAEMHWKIRSLLGFKLMKLYSIRDSPSRGHLMLTMLIIVSKGIVKRNSQLPDGSILPVFLQT